MPLMVTARKKKKNERGSRREGGRERIVESMNENPEWFANAVVLDIKKGDRMELVVNEVTLTMRSHSLITLRLLTNRPGA